MDPAPTTASDARETPERNRRLRILVHGINFTPELVGIGKTTGEMTDWLASRGHEVHVVTAPPFNPEWKVWDGYSAWGYRSESLVASGSANEMRVERCPVWVPSRPTGLRRLLHHASFALSSIPVMMREVFWKPNVVMILEPTLLCAPAALATARLSRATSWLHVQDFEVDAAFAMGGMNSAVLQKSALWVERFLMSWFDRMSTISARMMDRMRIKGAPAERCVFFPNWVDTTKIFPLSEPNSYRKELGIPSETVVALYSGSIGRKQGLETVIEAARELASNQNLQFVFCGQGPNVVDLKRQCEDMGNVRWLPLQPFERLNELLNLADIHLLPQSADAADLVMPSKLTGMMASGRPVIATAEPGTQLASVVEDHGLVIPPANTAQMCEAIVQLAADAALRARFGDAARTYAVEVLSTDTIMSAFERELFAVVGSSGRNAVSVIAHAGS